MSVKKFVYLFIALTMVVLTSSSLSINVASAKNVIDDCCSWGDLKGCYRNPPVYNACCCPEGKVSGNPFGDFGERDVLPKPSKVGSVNMHWRVMAGYFFAGWLR